MKMGGGGVEELIKVSSMTCGEQGGGKVCRAYMKRLYVFHCFLSMTYFYIILPGFNSFTLYVQTPFLLPTIQNYLAIF